ncbi:alpha-glucosidase [Clostridium sp. YIM B02505]|uniref:Alpha-glucosidase n=1 Tax=Clostridium yunnanense TaxID=2800325 RepID=A0ABS1EQX7_9CLOT|nr:alpha-glucosidase [Clostridium yunnanense]MBK1811750.1 alpha-glucosidase [Clostridium yunnanense]
MDRQWWKEGIAYQVYVRSFKDSNKDGIGDIHGIIEKLDYLKDLGVNILYLNPINKSPNYDNGYDISDFRDIMDEFGTINDFYNLVSELHKRDMKLILDMVINHTSHLHPWFQESRKSKDNPYRDYYIWHPGKNGKPVNNWGSFFGGSAWEYDETTDEYYLHIFSKEQPDLNWKNEKVREEIKDMIKFWVDKGVDGFRFDAINHLAKDLTFPDGPINKGQVYGDFMSFIQNLPEGHEIIKDIRNSLFKDKNHVIIGETGNISFHNAYLYTGLDRNELDMTFHFDINGIGLGKDPWEKGSVDLAYFKKIISGWQMRDESEGWCPLFYSNHDSTRTVSRLGDDTAYWKESAKMLALLQFTQKGTPFIYYGDEIGMTNAWEFKLEDYRDIQVFNKYKDFVESGLVSEENYLLGLRNTSRDNSRTPMQWDKSSNSGFTVETPWINVNSNYKEINVKKQIEDASSILNFYKQLISLRKSNLALIYGDFNEIHREDKNVYSYMRTLEDSKFLIIANFFGEETDYLLPEDIEFENCELLLSNYDISDHNISSIRLNPYECRLYRLI